MAEVLHDYGVRFIRSHSAVTLEYFWWAHMSQGGSLDVLVSHWVPLYSDDQDCTAPLRHAHEVLRHA